MMDERDIQTLFPAGIRLPKPTVRCSELDRFLSCPGSRTLAEMLPIDFTFSATGNAMTWRGNWVHADSAARLVQFHGAIAPDGLQEPSLPAGWTPTDWDERTSQWYVDQIVTLTPQDHAIVVEKRFKVEFERFFLTGQIDCYTMSPDGEYFVINDDKAGPNIVDHAESNWQLAGYATLLKRKFPRARAGKLRILQKLADEPITEVDVEDLDTLAAYMEGRINLALDEYLTLETGYKACRLCPCIEFCPALDEEITEMKKILTPETVAALKVAPNLNELAEIAARGRAIAGPIIRLLETLKERVAEEGSVVLKDGTSVEIVNELGKREVTAPKIALAFAAEKLGDVDLAWKTMKMSLATLEDQLVDAGMQRKSKKDDVETAETWIRDTLGHLITRPEQKTLRFR